MCGDSYLPPVYCDRPSHVVSVPLYEHVPIPPVRLTLARLLQHKAADPATVVTTFGTGYGRVDSETSGHGNW